MPGMSGLLLCLGGLFSVGRLNPLWFACKSWYLPMSILEMYVCGYVGGTVETERFWKVADPTVCDGQTRPGRARHQLRD